MMTTEIRKFNILDHLDKLTPAKGKNRYYCPSCKGNNLTIDPKTGEYQCWSGCECKDIREAIRPWSEVLESRDAQNPTRRVVPAPRRSKPKPKPAPIPEGKIKIARLSGEVTHLERTPLVWDEATEALKYIIYQESDQEKIPLESLKHNCTTIRYPYSSAQWVTRIDYPHPEKPKGYWKTLRPFHRTKDGVEKIGKGNHSWDAYRFAEVLSQCTGQWAIAVEGEDCVEAARFLGLAAFTFQGGSWSSKDIETAAKTLKKAKAGGIVYFPDNDDAGFKKAEKLQEVCTRIAVPLLLINPGDVWTDIPDHGDISDWLKWGMEQGWNKEEFIRRLEKAFNQAGDEIAHEHTEQSESVDITTRFKADLLAIANLDDPIVQLLKINELASNYRIPANEIRRALSKTEFATRTPKAQFSTIDDFLNMEVEGVDYLIPGLLPRGESVLCVALPKVGKTLLSIDAAFAVATGESDFLGERVKQGKVLLISVDESPQSTRFKLMKRGFRHGDNLAIMTQWDVSQMGELEAKLEDFRPDLVIIDSLKRITVGREISENSAEFADIIYRLKELVGRYGAASILIHHANKNAEAYGVGKVRGSTAITGACWGIWQLDHIIKTTDENGKPLKKPKFDPSDPRRAFTATCRDTDSRSFLIEFDPENHSYSVASSESEGERDRKTQEQLILDLLAKHHPSGLTGREIMESLGLGKGVYTVLNRMISRKTVTHRRSKTDRRMMVYCLPNSGDTPPPLPCEEMLTKFSESTMVEGQIKEKKLVNKSDQFSQQFSGKTPEIPPVGGGVDNLKSSPSKDESEISQQLSTTQGGCVCVETENTTPELAQGEADAPDPNEAPPEAPVQKLDAPVCQQINAEMKRLGWSREQGRDYLIETYGKRSRQLLTDEELLDFLNHLQGIECEF